MLQFRDGSYHIYVDGSLDASGLHSVPDNPETSIMQGAAIGHHVSNGFANGDMVPAFQGQISNVQWSDGSSGGDARNVTARVNRKVTGHGYYASLSDKATRFRRKVLSIEVLKELGLEQLGMPNKETGEAPMRVVRLEHIGNPGHFLIMHRRKIAAFSLTAFKDNPAFADYVDLFILHPGLAGGDESVSLESVAAPGGFVCHGEGKEDDFEFTGLQQEDQMSLSTLRVVEPEREVSGSESRSTILYLLCCF